MLGYPRIGARRELTRATEAFWAGQSSADDLESTAAELRRGVWETLRDAGLDGVPSNTFSLYDHVLVSAPRLAEDAEVMARLAALGGGQPRSPYGTRRAA